VIGIRAHAETSQFAIDSRTASLGVLVLFKHQHTGTFTQDEAVAILVPRTAGRLRIIVARRQCPRRTETTKTERRNRTFGTAGNHDIRVAVLNQTTRIPNAVRSGGTGTDQAIFGPL
jgi:hypothetical protein